MKELLLILPEKLLKDIDDFRFKNRFSSRLKAIRYLLEYALRQNPEVIDDTSFFRKQEKEKKADIKLRFDVDGELQVIDEIDGLYVVGKGIVKQVNSYDEGLILIEKMKRGG